MKTTELIEPLEAAREILNDRLIIAYIAPDGIVHKQLMKKYGLEG